MSEIFHFSAGIYLKWYVQKPCRDTSRTSPTFPYLGTDWYLELQAASFNDRAYSLYSLHLRPAGTYKFVDKEAELIVFIYSIEKKWAKYLENLHLQKNSYNSPEADIHIIGNDEPFGHWHVYILFPTDLPSDCQLICHVKESETYKIKDDSTQTTARLPTLSSDFSTLLKDETFSDVRLTCEGRTFSAHRCILAARSEYFAAMFRNKMAESEAGVVDIKDVSPDVLELLLEYVYSEEMPDLSESTARRLYEEADKYAIHSLRDACSDWMVEYQTPDNCLDLLVLADEHSDKKFVEAVVCFAAEHLASLSVESWSAFKERYPLLVLPVLEKRLADSLPRAV